MLQESTHDNEDPATLVARIHRGDRLAEEALVREHRPRLVGLLRQLCRDPDRAEDLAHETLIIVIERLRDRPIDNPHQLATFILSTAKFHFIGWTRRHGNRVGLVSDCEELVHHDDDGESAYARHQSRRLVASTIDRLGVQRDRDILQRIYLHGQEKGDVCEALELDSEHFDKVISRARRRLREIVSELALVPEPA